MRQIGHTIAFSHPWRVLLFYPFENKRKDIKMKNSKKLTALLSLLLFASLMLSLVGCGGINTAKLWENATYQNDITVGEGDITFDITIRAGDKSIVLTVSTNESILGTALLAENIISGDVGDYGLYIKKVNGISADYDIDKAYWAFYINGEYALSGVDSTEIVEGENYELVYTR